MYGKLIFKKCRFTHTCTASVKNGFRKLDKSPYQTSKLQFERHRSSTCSCPYLVIDVRNSSSSTVSIVYLSV